MKKKTTEEKLTTEEELNYEHYKSGYLSYKKSMGKMARAFVLSCPSEILINELKKKKIIERDWGLNGEKYRERKLNKNGG